MGHFGGPFSLENTVDFQVTLRLTVNVPTIEEAKAWADSAVEHLTDTFNDEERIQPQLSWTTARPAP